MEHSLALLENSLLKKCNIKVPNGNWKENHEQLLAKDKAPRKISSSLRLKPRLVTREISWKLNPSLFPESTIDATFMLQYFRQPEMISEIVNRLYSCTKGLLGEGQLPGRKTELLINVDDASEFEKWHTVWKETDEGGFVVPIFSHNIHENRGYNNLANLAKGKIIFLFQDDDIPPGNCSWLDKVFKIYQSWPNTGVVGLKTGRISTVGYVWDEANPVAWLREGSDPFKNRLKDPNTGVRMYFASVVDVGPMAFLRDLWIEMGGYDEAYCKAGESCIMADWQLTFRSWLAGYQVSGAKPHRLLHFFSLFPSS